VVRTKQDEESLKDKGQRTERLARAGKVYELDERTARFGEDIIRFARGLKRDPINIPLISQVVRSGTSVGANYMEAGAAQSGKDFDHKVGICKKEARETMHWLRMLVAADSSSRTECRVLWREAHERTMIFSAILKKRRG
jgi:four helix bundle protein